MTIAHLALWTRDLEAMKRFYELHFGGVSGRKYVNPLKEFESYFLSFDSGVRLELMRKGGEAHAGPEGGGGSPEITGSLGAPGHTGDAPCGLSGKHAGFAHIAFSVGSEAEVDLMTERLSRSGVEVISPPRRTGDGYYESVIADPEGNTVEITA